MQEAELPRTETKQCFGCMDVLLAVMLNIIMFAQCFLIMRRLPQDGQVGWVLSDSQVASSPEFDRISGQSLPEIWKKAEVQRSHWPMFFRIAGFASVQRAWLPSFRSCSGF